jgi:hypothetical protein
MKSWPGRFLKALVEDRPLTGGFGHPSETVPKPRKAKPTETVRNRLETGPKPTETAKFPWGETAETGPL